MDLVRKIFKSAGQGLPLVLVKAIAKQLLTALRYLHLDRCIIHGDLKPDNILFAKPLLPHEYTAGPPLELLPWSSKLGPKYPA